MTLIISDTTTRYTYILILIAHIVEEKRGETVTELANGGMSRTVQVTAT